MGVRGFTTFISRNSHLFLKNFELKNCYIIIDGSGIAIHLYQWHTVANDCFGGDYDKYADTVYNFFNLLKKCNIIPIILFDGGYENKKLRTVCNRMRNRMLAIKNLNPGTEGRICIYPLFIKDLFLDIAIKLNIKCIRNDYESDSEIVCLARNLDCPILGFDSDFYFFDTCYVPFNTFEMKIIVRHNKKLNKDELYIPCQMYNIENFLKYFGGLNKVTLPLLPVLLGNDYINKSFFSAFHKHLKLKKHKNENEQQRLIKSVISWLRHETLESAISKIIGRFKEKKRRFILYKLNNAMIGYLQVNSLLIDYLNEAEQLLIKRKEEHNINILEIEPTIEEDEDDVISEEEVSLEDEEEYEVTELVEELESKNQIQIDSNESNSSENEEYETKLENSVLNISNKEENGEKLFLEKYKRCYLPQSFVDIRNRNTYFCFGQVEDFSNPHSHTISLEILSAIFKILKENLDEDFICVARTDKRSLRKGIIPITPKFLPTFEEIQNFSTKDCKIWMFNILNIDQNFEELLDVYPSDWHIFLIALYYWKTNSKITVDKSFIYSTIICSIILNFVDEKIGFCRSWQTFHKKYKNCGTNNIIVNNSKSTTVKSSFNNISYCDSVNCLKTFLDYFNTETKLSSNSKLFDVSVVGQFSQFQSCLLHIKYLNSIFNFPFENILVSKFFNGTFLYNATINFRKRNNLNLYINSLFDNCHSILCCFEKVMETIEKYFGVLCDSNARKTRKRKRRKKNQEEGEEVFEDKEEEDENFIDDENFYSLLKNVEI